MKMKYVPDLSKQMALCEANYARLLKLLLDFEQCELREFIVEKSEQKLLVSISVQERFKFTTTLLMKQLELKTQAHSLAFGQQEKATSSHLTDSVDLDTALAPQLLIRLYHDANLAEVVSPTNAAQLKGKYDYPNEEMFQVDEKIQLNSYLAQWLNHCLLYGYTKEEQSEYLANDR